MFLSNRDIFWAIKQKLLVVDPPPHPEKDGYDETSIDLHLGDTADAARVWDVAKYAKDHEASVENPELRLGTFKFGNVSGKYLKPVPQQDKAGGALVFARDKEVIVKPQGFVLWSTHERVGTPVENPQYICFVDAKSTRARTGIVVHMTAPTIHAGWSGTITLEIANFGPFHLVLKPGDAIAQLTVATISSAPDLELKAHESQTTGQVDPTGSPDKKKAKGRSHG